jgi:hypothetical protein
MVFPLHLQRIALQNEFRVLKHGRAQDVLGLDKALDFQTWTQYDDTPRPRGEQQ